MIHVSVNRDLEGRVNKIQAQGHAEYADYGQDIICAATTAVITTAMAALEDLLGIEHERILEEGDVALILDRQVHEKSTEAKQIDLVLETCVLGLKQIEFSYGNDYITVRDRV